MISTVTIMPRSSQWTYHVWKAGSVASWFQKRPGLCQCIFFSKTLHNVIKSSDSQKADSVFLSITA